MGPKVVAIIQARIGSTRLPGKVLKNLFGKTVLEHVAERVKQSKAVHKIVIATTNSERDNKIVDLAGKIDAKYYRGSEEDVLSRYYHAAKENNADIVVRITSDCPLIDPHLIDEIVLFFLREKYDLVTNTGANSNQRTYPRGLDIEVFSFQILAEAFKGATEDYQKEHVTPYMYKNKNTKIYYYKNKKNYSKYRWTLDTREDFELIKTVYKYLYKGVHDFYFDDILKLFELNPDLCLINANVKQKGLQS